MSLAVKTVSCSFLLIALGCTKKSEPEVTMAEPAVAITDQKIEEKPFEYCADHVFCADLREHEEQCRQNKNEKHCKEFVMAFEKLSVKKDCQRRFDSEPVPSVWICDEVEDEETFPKLFERSAATLSKLKYPFARDFYGSEAFRSTLDGAIAEDHMKESLKAAPKKK